MVAATPKPDAEHVAHRALLSNISWETYTRLGRDSEGRGVRLTYDSGWLEIEMPSLKHERIKELVGQLVAELMLSAGVDFVAAGSTTWRTETSLRGAEPDQCYYISHFEQMKDVQDVDLAIHLPPDLVIEVDLSSPSIDTQPIYASLGVPELWRIRDDLSIEFFLLEREHFVRSATSRAISNADGAMLTQFLSMGATAGHSRAIQAFREVLRG